MDLPAGAVLGGHTLLRKLGSGGMGAVYAARHPNLPRDVALKVMHPGLTQTATMRARFEREAELLCRLSHPNVVNVLDRGQDGDYLWISMQYIQGTDLAGLLEAEGALSRSHALAVLTAVGDALDHAHACGLLHRDVKPANILLAPQPNGSERVFLTDFGIAKTMEGSQALTQQGEVLATFAYAPPEQVLGAPLDHRGDVYSLGAVFFEMVTGRRVFDSENVLTLMWSVTSQPAPDVRSLRPDLPPTLSAVLARALAKDPQQRFDSCGDLAEAAQAAWPGPVTAPATVITQPGMPAPHPLEPPRALFPPPSSTFPPPLTSSALPATTGSQRLPARWLWPLAGGVGVALVAVTVTILVLRESNGDGGAGGSTGTDGADPSTTTAEQPLTIAAANLEIAAEDALEPELGQRPDITCPEDLPAEVGAETRCIHTAPGSGAQYGVTVIITSVEGTEAQFDVHLDGQPLG